MNDLADDLAISVRQVNKTFGSTRALRSVNFSVRAGESHALLGRNGAGKSTLISVLTGMVVPDSGTVEIRSGSDSELQVAGVDKIACVYQRSTLIDSLTAAENISLGNYPETAGGFVSWKVMNDRAVALLKDWGYQTLAQVTVDQLKPLQRKVVEVCRAMARGPRVLLLDEPTAGLDEGASAELFAQIDAARARGVTIVYVSHHLDEIFRVCDAVTILRDGSDVRHSRIQDITVQGIVEELAGDTSEATEAEQADVPAGMDRDEPIVLQVEKVRVDGALRPTSLQLRRGEAVGLTGLDGAGQVQLAQVIVGQRSADDGLVIVDDRPVQPGSARAAIDSGIGFVPEDRHHSGFAPDLSLEENVTFPIIRRISNRLGIVNSAARRRRYHELSSAWMVKAAAPTQAVAELSGGNQQKVVLARALSADPSVLVLIHPTAGVDVAAKAAIYASIRSLQAQGRAVLIVSSDGDDLKICDRVEVMYRGARTESLERGWSERDLIAAVQGAKA